MRRRIAVRGHVRSGGELTSESSGRVDDCSGHLYRIPALATNVCGESTMRISQGLRSQRHVLNRRNNNVKFIREQSIFLPTSGGWVRLKQTQDRDRPVPGAGCPSRLFGLAELSPIFRAG